MVVDQGVVTVMSDKSDKGDALIPDNVGEYRKKEYWDWRYEQ